MNVGAKHIRSIAIAAALLWPVASLPVLAQAQAIAPQTVVRLHVEGCDGCTIQPVQNKNGQVPYWGPSKTVVDGNISFPVPTGRTSHMAFLVYAPFDELAQDGIPMVAITRFKEKSAGAQVAWSYARKTHRASGCWSGTSRDMVRNTLVVKQISVNGRTLAVGFMAKTWPSGRYWARVDRANYHSTDPSICP